MKITTQDLLAASAEGRLGTALVHEQKYSDKSSIPQQGIFRLLVLDVIHDPNTLDEEKIEYYRNVLGVSNVNIARHLPRNSIIGKKIGETSADNFPPMFFFPFMPSHVAMPCKAGEHVWAMFEAPDIKTPNVGWWMWRIVELDHADDVNHSHAPRNLDPTFFKGQSAKAIVNETTTPFYDFQNGIAVELDGERLSDPASAYVSGDELTYERLLTDSDASKITSYEAVPRYKKRPGDLVLEGSNNAVLVLGTDRVGAASDTNVVDGRGQVPFTPVTDISGSNCGAIQLVVGRGQTPETAGTSVENSLGRQELAKSVQERTLSEGDLDPVNDRTSLNLCQRTLVDINNNIAAFNEQNFTVSDRVGTTNETSGDGAAVVRSDKVRIIARSDIELLVTSFERDEFGNMKVIEDTTRWAALVIKSNGDIIFKPAVNGVIKLGSENANKAILCTQAVNSTQPNGTVQGAPIISTMGGSVGTGVPNQGVWATKILVD